MAEISRNLLSYRAVMPRWFIALLIAGAILALVSSFTFLDKAQAPMSTPPPVTAIPEIQNHGRAPASIEPSLSSPPAPDLREAIGTNNPAIFFGIAFCSIAAAISALVLLVSLPVFLFSSNAERVARAGGLVKTTLGFFVGSAGTIIATISFAPI